MQFIVFGQHEGLGEYLLERVKNRKEGSRSTQSVEIGKLIKDWVFFVIVPPDKKAEYIYKQLINYKKSFENLLELKDLKRTKDVRI